MSSLISGNISVSAYKFNAADIVPTHGTDIDNMVEEWLSSAPSKLPTHDTPSIGFAGSYYLDNDFSADNIKKGEVYIFYVCSASFTISKNLVDAACLKAEKTVMRTEDISYIGRRRRQEIREEALRALLADVTHPTINSTCVMLDMEQGDILIHSNSDKVCDDVIRILLEVSPIHAVYRGILTMSGMYPVEQYSMLDLSGEHNSTESDNITAMGTDFLTWLWFRAESNPQLMLPTLGGEISIAIDGPITMQAETSRAQVVTLKKGIPTLSEEVEKCFYTGKKPTKAKVSIALGDDVWAFMFTPGTFSVSSCSLPEGEAMENAERIFERYELTVQLFSILEELFGIYLNSHLDQTLRAQMWEWANNRL